MPRIQQYEEQVGLKATEISARQSVGEARAFGNALGNFGRTVTDVGLQFKAYQDRQRQEQEQLRKQAEEREAHAWAQEQESFLQRDYHVKFNELQKQVPEDGKGFNETFMNVYNTDISNRINQAPSQRAAELFQSRATNLGDNYFTASYNWETKAKEGYTTRALERAGQNRVQAAIQGANPFELNAQTDADYEANVAILGPAQASKIRDETKRGVSLAALTREVEGNPEAYLNRSSRYTGIANRTDIQVDLNQLVNAIATQESGNRHTNKDGSIVTSKAGAQGVMQLMPDTGKELAEAIGEVYDPFDEDQNRRLGAQYFEQMSAKYGDTRLALAAYNAGPGRVDQAIAKAGEGATWADISKNLPQETQAYVPSVLRKSGIKDAPQEGVDPVKARSQEISDGLMSHLSVSDILTLNNRAEGDINARQKQAAADARRVQLEQEAARKEQAARATSELEIMVSRGEASYKEVNEAYGKNLLTPQKYADLTLKIDDRNKKQAEKLVSWERVGQALSGQGGVIDPGNAEDRKAVSSFYQERLQPQFAAMPPDLRVANQAEYVRLTGIMPENMQGQLRATLRTGSPEQIIESANLINQVQNVRPEALSSLSSDDLAIGVGVSELMNIGVPPQEAVKRIKERFDPDNKQVIEARDTAYKKKISAGNKEMPNFEKLTKNAIGGDLVKEAGGYEMAIADYQTAYKDAYLRTGDFDLAQKIAEVDIKRVWGVSEVTGSKRVMKYPPDKYYGVPGAPERWISNQLIADVNGAISLPDGERRIVGHEDKGGGRSVPIYENVKSSIKKEDIFIIADQNTAREASAGTPKYQIVYKDKDGVLQSVLKDGKPVRWYPSPKDSDVLAKWQSDNKLRTDQYRDRAKAERQASAAFPKDPRMPYVAGGFFE